MFYFKTKDNLGNFHAKSNVGINLGYSSSKAYRVFNKKTMVVMNLTTLVKEKKSVDDDIGLDFFMG